MSEPDTALLVVHGHSRDAAGSFNATLSAARQAGQSDRTVVIAPIFQVDAASARRCSSRDTPPAQAGDAAWTCGSWAAGALAGNSVTPVSSFAALDALVAEAKHQWPGLRTITLAGFSAGAQLLQHSIVFAAPAPPGVSLRYVVVAPGSWLYLDDQRPALLRDDQDSHRSADPASNADLQAWAACSAHNTCRFAMQKPSTPPACNHYNEWKYGLDALPSTLSTPSSPASTNAQIDTWRARYRSAQVAYAVGAFDNDASHAARFAVLDKSCAAKLQGPFRLQRAMAFHAYEQAVVRPTQPRTLTIISGCAHSASCVLPAPEMRPLLFPQ